MSFERKLSKDLILKLKNEDLYKDYLLKDIKSCEVFPAIRNNEIHFYYKGGRLFKYTSSGFASNIKYAFVCKTCYKDDIYENDLQNEKLKPVKNFIEGYKDIKDCCGKYNEHTESAGVAELYKKYSYFNSNPDDTIILDIEASLDSFDEEKSRDRFDIVLLNKGTNSIKIVEAKQYSNPQLQLSKSDSAEVVLQIQRYEENIKNRNKEIINAYKNYIKIVNDLFDITLPDFDKIEPHVGLLYFNFSQSDKDSKRYKKLNEVLNNELPDNDIYPIGHISSAKLTEKLF